MTIQPFFKVENLTKRFGGLTAVNNVSFEVQRDEIVGLIGPNGAGKSTLVKLLMKILQPDEGKICINGKDITKVKPWHAVEHGIAGTFQDTRPFRRLPIISNVMLPSLGPRASRNLEWGKSIKDKAYDILEFVGVADLAAEPASKLSQGDLKRLEIARAMAAEPELLILDEPFAGLNAAETDLLAKSIKRLHRGGRFGRLHSDGVAMIIIEHKLSELMKLADRVIVLNFGELIAAGTPNEVMNDDKVIEAYIGKEVI